VKGGGGGGDDMPIQSITGKFNIFFYNFEDMTTAGQHTKTHCSGKSLV
jgi:hypothetical protein